MNMISNSRIERLVAKRYEEKGYVVTLDPPRSAFPFALDSHWPDILATKGDDHILIAVKSATSKVDPEAYLRLDREVQKHSGWRFLLVTVNELELQDPAWASTNGLSIEKIEEQLGKIDKIAEDEDLAGLILPQLWTVYMSVLRLLAVEDDLNAEHYSDLSFLNQAYSKGMLSFEEYESAKRLMIIRNQAAHSLESSVTTQDWAQLRQMVNAAIKRRPGSAKRAAATAHGE